jgi:O-succinylbenzoate synthase
VILVEVAARGVSGWGECPLSWELRGVWESLEQALAPALLAEPFGAPSELEVIWDDVVGVASARAGLEAAVWDLWARANDVPLTTALGQEARPVPRAVAVELPPMVGGDPRAFLHRVLDGVGTEADMLHVALHPPFEHRWGAPILEEADRSVAFDLGGRCGRQDMAALRALDALGPALIIQPFARGLEHHAARLRRVAHAPISLGGFPSAETAEAAVMAHACDVLHVEPGWIGATEALRVLDVADVHGLPAWVSGAAVTPVGAAMDAAVAAHPAVTLPSRLGSVSAAASARGPDRAWLSAQALAVRVLRA